MVLNDVCTETSSFLISYGMVNVDSCKGFVLINKVVGEYLPLGRRERCVYLLERLSCRDVEM